MNYRLILLAGISTVALSACSGNGDNSGEAAVEAPASQPAEMSAGAPAEAPAAPATIESSSARVFIISPDDGATVESPVKVVFGIENFGLAPAGTYEARTGHHHLLIDTELPPMGEAIPADDNHLHFGKAQTETTIELSPGEHTLRLLLADGNHVPHNPVLVSAPVTITVTDGSAGVE
jgi:hypothetical protein